MWQIYHEIKNLSKPIFIKGVCASACTYAFSYKDTCVYEDAIIIIHKPSYMGTVNDFWYNDLKNSYPQKLKNWFGTIDNRDYTFSGIEMNEKFGIKICK